MTKKKKDEPKEEELKKCKITLCEDSDGKVVAVYDGNCPAGTIEVLAGKIAIDGITFRKKIEVETLKSGGT